MKEGRCNKVDLMKHSNIYGTLGLLFFGVVATSGCSTVKPLSMVEVDPAASVVFRGTPEAAFQIARKALISKGISPKSGSPQEGFVSGEHGPSAWSWGEIVTVYFKKRDDSTSVMWVKSQAKLSTNVTAIDWTGSILEAIERQIAYQHPSGSREAPTTPPQQPSIEIADCRLEELPAQSEETSLAVLSFQVGEGLSTEAGEALADLCRETIQESGRYLLVDREQMKLLLSEEDFASTISCDDTRCLVDYGKKLRAQKIVHGRISRVAESFVLTIKILDVGSATIEAIRTATVRGKLDDLIVYVRPTTCHLLHTALER